jgi:aryl-alcohol dehydrogenase-like predicted oxidoreductase
MKNSTSPHRPIQASGAITLGGLHVHRLGYGAMQITGKGVWGAPANRAEAIAVLRRAVELGVDLIDTADSYGPYVSEELIKEALHPYPKELVIATKAGLARTGPDQWHPLGRPVYLRQECEMSLRRLGVDCIDLFQLHRIDPDEPAEKQFRLLADLQKEGKIRHVGLSEVSVAEIKAAQKIVPIVTVQNRYNLIERQSEAVLEFCEKQKIGFIPWFPIASGKLARPGSVVDRVAKAATATASQISLAWLLRRSPVMMPIPGTSKVAHLEENCAAAAVKLTDEQFDELSGLTVAHAEGPE